jgi:hypothetical protein
MNESKNLLTLLDEHLQVLHDQMDREQWEGLYAALERLQPRLDGSPGRRARFEAWSDLLRICRSYDLVRKILPADPSKMLTGPPDPNAKEDQPVEGMKNRPPKNRLIYILDRMKEMDRQQLLDSEPTSKKRQ